METGSETHLGSQGPMGQSKGTTIDPRLIARLKKTLDDPEGGVPPHLVDVHHEVRAHLKARPQGKVADTWIEGVLFASGKVKLWVVDTLERLQFADCDPHTNPSIDHDPDAPHVAGVAEFLLATAARGEAFLDPAEIQVLRSLVPQWKDVPSDWTPLAARLKVCTAREDFRQAVYTRWEELPDKWKKADWASPFCFVLEHELKEIFAKRGHRAAEGTNSDNRGGEKTKRAPVGQALDANLVGLAFSGGGIRSATFNLGVLQGLARYKLLRRVDYLSTVSGGGYIGAFLLSWLGQGPVDDETGVAHQKKPPEHTRETSRHMDDLERALSTEETPCPDSAAKRPIFFLRRFSNYLAPESSFFSVDTWTMFSIWGRNVLLNFMILASLFACVLLIPRLAYWIPRGTAGKILVWAGQFRAAGLLGGAAFLIGCNLWKIRSVQKLCREGETGAQQNAVAGLGAASLGLRHRDSLAAERFHLFGLALEHESGMELDVALCLPRVPVGLTRRCCMRLAEPKDCGAFVVWKPLW